VTGPRAVLRIPFATVGDAQRAASALRVDDDAFVVTRVEGDVLLVEARAKNVRSLLRALDDAIATAAVSEDLLRAPAFDDE
jgi:hypothetical protein